MLHESLTTQDWDWTIAKLGGAELISSTARQSKAFVRAREVKSAIDLLRLTLAYCLGHVGLRSTAAWAEATGVASLSDVALLGRLRNTGDWLSQLIGRLLEKVCPQAARGRVIRILDGTSFGKAGCEAKRSNSLWRIHASFELPSERFDFLELTDETGGERMDRVAVVPGEIRIGDAGLLQVDQIGVVLSEGADVLVRASWRHARWLDKNGKSLDLLTLLKAAHTASRIDRPIWLGRSKGAAPLAMRLIAVRKPAAAAAETRRKARLAARRKGRQVSAGTLAASEWVILVTSLPKGKFSTEDIVKLYRMRWRIELAFKRLKSLVGLRSPPVKDPRLAKPWILSHLLMILLVEPLMDEFGVSPS